jgi:hypothetical protein
VGVVVDVDLLAKEVLEFELAVFAEVLNEGHNIFDKFILRHIIH